VGVQLQGTSPAEVTESLEELGQLTTSAGAEVLLSVQQKKSRPDPATFIGKGKAFELKGLSEAHNADVVIFDEDLSPAQQRNLENILETKVVDRAELILDIFSQRAQTREGKLQVELAQLHYRLPRLTGQGVLLSRLGGGIGTRGPGETKLEVDRRRIRDKIRYLEKAIEEIKQHRGLQRSRRKETQIRVAALVGYTNAGKSTLLNHLCQAQVLVEDKLFATLDPTSRQLILPNGQMIVLTDTVGFIRKLPHQLIAAFRATLEEILEADVLLHVVDCHHTLREEQFKSVLEVLKEIGAETKPIITVLNKVDLLSGRQEFVDRLVNSHEPAVAISAINGLGFDELETLLMKQFARDWQRVTLKIPHSRADILAQIHEVGRVMHLEYKPDGTYVEVSLQEEWAKKFEGFKVS
jgi:GTP-binding protein HflX